MLPKLLRSNNKPHQSPDTSLATTPFARGDPATSPQRPDPPEQPDKGQNALPVVVPRAGNGRAGLCPIRTVIVELGELRQELASMAEKLTQVAGQSAALEQLASQNRLLGERHHQREVLGVVFHTLIGMRDRTCQAQLHLKRQLRSAGAVGHTRRFARLEAASKEKEADAVVIAQVLAQFGVEPFTEPPNTFVPSTQHCLQRVKTSDSARHGQIARRLAAGYRRGDTIIRREQVSVYVADDSSGDQVHKENEPCPKLESTSDTREAKPDTLTPPADSHPYSAIEATCGSLA